MLLLKTTYICSLVIVVMNLAHKIFIKEFISVDELSQIRMTVRCRNGPKLPMYLLSIYATIAKKNPYL